MVCLLIYFCVLLPSFFVDGNEGRCHCAFSEHGSEEVWESVSEDEGVGDVSCAEGYGEEYIARESEDSTYDCPASEDSCGAKKGHYFITYVLCYG